MPRWRCWVAKSIAEPPLRTPISLLALAIALCGCQSREPEAPPAAAAPASCSTDVDCASGQRCDQGYCGVPSAPPTPATGTEGRASEPASQGAQDIANDGGIPGVPGCKPGDGRRGIPVWAPPVRGLQVDAAPPAEAGQIVYLRLDVSDTSLECRDAETARFTLGAGVAASAEAGAIAVRGNTQQIGQVCRYSGLYRNETTNSEASKDGAKDQAAVARFVAVEPSEVVSTNQYCLTSPPPADGV
jgi:hypothetical protein